MEFVMTDYNEGTKFDGEDYSIGDIWLYRAWEHWRLQTFIMMCVS